MKKFFLIIKNEKVGPLLIEEINQYEISSETLVWREGFDSWKRIKEVEELENLLIVQPPPIPNKSNDIYQVEAKIIEEKKNSSKTKKYLAEEIISIFKIFSVSLIATIIFFSVYQLIYVQPYLAKIKTLENGTSEQKVKVISSYDYLNSYDSDCEKKYIDELKLHAKDYPIKHWELWFCKNEKQLQFKFERGKEAIPYYTDSVFVSLYSMSKKVAEHIRWNNDYHDKCLEMSNAIFFILLIGILLIKYSILLVKWLIFNSK